jgi:hypothetical protein
VIPVCTASRETGSVLSQLELKTLELNNCQSTQTVAQLRRQAEQERPSD